MRGNRISDANIPIAFRNWLRYDHGAGNGERTDDVMAKPSHYWPVRTSNTSSSAVAERPRDALCPLVVSLNKIITRVESLIIVI